MILECCGKFWQVEGPPDREDPGPYVNCCQRCGRSLNYPNAQTKAAAAHCLQNGIFDKVTDGYNTLFCTYCFAFCDRDKFSPICFCTKPDHWRIDSLKWVLREIGAELSPGGIFYWVPECHGISNLE